MGGFAPDAARSASRAALRARSVGVWLETNRSVRLSPSIPFGSNGSLIRVAAWTGRWLTTPVGHHQIRGGSVFVEAVGGLQSGAIRTRSVRRRARMRASWSSYAPGTTVVPGSCGARAGVRAAQEGLPDAGGGHRAGDPSAQAAGGVGDGVGGLVGNHRASSRRGVGAADACRRSSHHRHPLWIGPDRRHVGGLLRGADSRGEAAPVVKRPEQRCRLLCRITIGRSQSQDVPRAGLSMLSVFGWGCCDGREVGGCCPGSVV